MSVTPLPTRQRWVVYCDPLTVASVKVLAASQKLSIGATLDMAVEYFSRKVVFAENKPLKWDLPDDF